VLAAVERPLLALCKRLAPDAAPGSEARLRAWVEVYYGAPVDELGWEPRAGEDDDTRQRRARILSIVGYIGEASAVRGEALRRCHRYLEERSSLDANLADPVVRMAAACGDEALYEAFAKARQQARTPQEKRRFLLALGDFADPALVRRSLALCLDDEVASQDVVSLLTRLFANRLAREATWAFVQRRWTALRRRIPPQHGSRLIAATPELIGREHRREVAGFFRDHKLPASERALRQALERFDWYADFRRRVGPQLEAYLAG
jgi:aminopeptidase N